MDPKELIIRIAKALVDYPEKVSIEEIDGAATIVFRLTVSQGDIGRVVGKQGRTADALRTILDAFSGKTGKRYVLDIVE